MPGQTITVIVTYTDGTRSERTMPVHGSVIDTINSFLADVRRHLDVYEMIGVDCYTFQITPTYSELWSLGALRRTVRVR